MIGARYKNCIALICLTFLLTATVTEAAKPAKSAGSPANVQHEATIEEVTSKNLERLLLEKDYVAVYWCKFTKDEINKGIINQKFKIKE